MKPQWLISSPSPAKLPTTEEMEEWITEGPRDPSKISSERYCSAELQSQLLAAKTAFDDVPSALFRSARERSNPFERIKGEFFQNRAALKKFQGVNKKALDQYTSFTEQRTELMERKQGAT